MGDWNDLTSAPLRIRFLQRVRRGQRSLSRVVLRLLPRAVVPFIWRSPLFDAEWYRRRYPDVLTKGVPPERHYRRHGVSEGRDPNRHFKTGWYLARNPDVQSSGMNPMDHYHLYGAWEGRDPGYSFSTHSYLDRYPDVRASGVDPLEHFIRRGEREGRTARAGKATALRRPTYVAKRARWRSLMLADRTDTAPGPLKNVSPERSIALVIDDSFPRTDRDAGSILTMHYVRLLQEAGHHVHFVADRRERADARYEAQLEIAGATTQVANPSLGEFLRLLDEDGDRVAIAVLSRAPIAEAYLDDIIFFCRGARTILLTQDLHHLRKERASKLAGDRVGMYEAAALRELEVHAARMADAAIVVSSAEKELLESAAAGANVYWCPLIQDVVGRTSGFAQRSGLAFIGAYDHQPNLDAIEYFLDEIWPVVHEAIPHSQFYAIGASMPESLRRRVADGYVPLGHVDDLAGPLAQVRLTVAPLRYGAGMKGKVLTSLAHGVPVVATPIAAESLDVRDSGISVAEDAASFAQLVLRLHEDERSWLEMSDAGMRWIDSNVSSRRGRERLQAVLADLGARPADHLPSSTQAVRYSR